MPDWVQPFKEPRTEIKFINGAYYKYAVSYRYVKEKGRTAKITGHLLGKITPEDGFVPSDKNILRSQGDSLPDVDIKTCGAYNLFRKLLSHEIQSLRAAFGAEEADRLLIFSLMRFAHQSPIKRIPHYHAHDYCSQFWHRENLSERQISHSLRFFGQNREKVVEWMRSLLDDSSEARMQDGFVMMDSTHVQSNSEKLAVNAKGYNSSFNFERQIRLMYIFSSHLRQPVYYRLINGNIVDSSSMPLCIEEFGLRNVVFVADKGFFSNENVNMLDRKQLQYIIPLRRNNGLVNASLQRMLKLKKDAGNHFFYQGRTIWYWESKRGGKKITSFWDDVLRAAEENDYLQRIESMPEKFTREGYIEKLDTFGTMTVLHKTERELSPKEIYETYKHRNEIEIMFDSYKNFLDADATHMQDRHVMEGWLLANFIAMLAYCKLFSRLKQAEMLSKYSPKDIVEMAKSVYMMKFKNEWHLSETTAKHRELFQKIKIDYLK